MLDFWGVFHTLDMCFSGTTNRWDSRHKRRERASDRHRLLPNGFSPSTSWGRELVVGASHWLYQGKKTPSKRWWTALGFLNQKSTMKGRKMMKYTIPWLNLGKLQCFTRVSRFPWNKRTSLPQLPFGVRDPCDVSIIWPDWIVTIPSLKLTFSPLKIDAWNTVLVSFWGV